MEKRMLPHLIWCFRNCLRLYLTLWIICSSCCLPYSVKAQSRIPTETVQLWASGFGGELNSIVTKYSGSLLLQKVSKQNQAFKMF
ncbi:hypothetical protein scyTo_0023633 [Scyliorhinus torazame]|uniref:Uncharacterized protein n=1 Tax=Scyliorhinus torazame TaxID=75743 RepID=A0A401QCG3_SCYTO|nr:hypothetical protein [Scyliorhinus torazame]